MFRFWVLVGLVVRLVWRGWRDLVESTMRLLLMIQVSRLLSVGYALLDAVDRV